jgi:hypothetical protein
MAQLFFNNFKSELAANLGIGATSVTVDDASALPTSVAAGDFYLLTLSDGPVETKWEIIRVDSGRTGNVIPIAARGQEGTADQAWVIDDDISARVTKQTLLDLGVAVEDEGTPVAGGPHTTLNFVGTGVTATDGGGGTATITVSGGGGGGGDANELSYDHWIYFAGRDPVDSQQLDIFYSKDGGVSWTGERRDNADGIGGTDTEDPKFAFGAGFNMPGIVTWGTALL